MYHVFLCDDEPVFLAELARRVRELLPDSEIAEYQDGEELAKALEELSCDLLLLDIDMPGSSGLEIAGRLSRTAGNGAKRPLLVFVTSHDELVYDSLQFHPFGFVRKDCLDREFSRVLRDCERELSGHKRHFCFHSAGSEGRIPLDEILYFEAEGNYIRLFAEGGEYRFRDTLTALENGLSDSGFIRLHKGFLVNQAAVRRLTSEEAQLRDGSRIPIGRSYGEDARKRLMRYMMG